MTSSGIAIVSSVFNEERLLADFLIDLIKKFNRDHIFLVDDCSIDSSKEIMVRFINEENIFSNAKNLGQGKSLFLAMKRLAKAGYTHAICLDCDLQHRPSDIDQFVRFKNEKVAFDIVVGSRYTDLSSSIGNQEMFRFLTNELYCELFTELTEIKITDCFSGFLMLDLSFIDRIQLNVNGYSWILEFWCKAATENAIIYELPIDRIYLDGEIRNFKNHYSKTTDIFLDLFNSLWSNLTIDKKSEKKALISKIITEHYSKNSSYYEVIGATTKTIIKKINFLIYDSER